MGRLFLRSHENTMQRVTMVTAAAMIGVAACLFGVLDARLLLQDKPTCPTVVDALKCDKTFGILKAAVAEAGLVDALTDPDADITVFAPTNKAFEAALDKLGLTKEELLASDKLADILKYHVVSGKIKSDEIPEGETNVPSLLGPDITVTNEGDVININDATVQYADIEAENGVVHVIDEVLLPPLEEDEGDGEDVLADLEDESGQEDEEEQVLGWIAGYQHYVFTLDYILLTFRTFRRPEPFQ